jgi:DedD protein
MSETAEPQLDELRRRARRRLIGAIVLALAAAVIVPMLLESDPKPLGEDVSVKIPPVDEGKFVSKLGDKSKAPPAASAKSAAPSATAPEMTPKEPPKEATREPTNDTTREAAKEPAKDAPAATPAVASSTPKPAGEPAPDAKPMAVDPLGKSASGTKDASPAGAAKAPEATAPGGAPAAKPSAVTANVDTTRSAASLSPDLAKPAVKPGTYSVQLAAFSDDKGANALAGKLRKAGHPAYTEPYTTSRGTLWRVRVGPYPTRDAAEAARAKLKADGQNGIIAAAN